MCIIHILGPLKNAPFFSLLKHEAIRVILSTMQINKNRLTRRKQRINIMENNKLEIVWEKCNRYF